MGDRHVEGLQALLCSASIDSRMLSRHSRQQSCDFHKHLTADGRAYAWLERKFPKVAVQLELQLTRILTPREVKNYNISLSNKFNGQALFKFLL